MEEGYIKFQANHQMTSALSANAVRQLCHWRQRCYYQNWIGAYDNGIGFGNISERCQVGHVSFYITGSATGNLATLTPNHIAQVTRTQPSHNQLWCKGPLLASSESMSHAAVYQALPWVQSVIHIHDLAYWRAILHRLPTTSDNATYGTPEMVTSIQTLLDQTNLATQQIFAMAGHEEGIFAFGRSHEDAFEVLMQHCP